MKYLSFIRSSESYRNQTPPPAMMEAMGAFVTRMFQEGLVVDTGGLMPSKDGFRIRLADGKLTLTDGPFSESKEIIGGWAVLQTSTREQAVRICMEFMDLHRKHWPGFEAESEVRPIEEFAHPGAR